MSMLVRQSVQFQVCPCSCFCPHRHTYVHMHEKALPEVLGLNFNRNLLIMPSACGLLCGSPFAYCFKMNRFTPSPRNLQWSSAVESLWCLIHCSATLGHFTPVRVWKVTRRSFGSGMSPCRSSRTSHFLLPLLKYFLWSGTYCLFV